ncbi:helix-turn-helix domain-containing protein [Citrobacter sp. NCU1]|uniref:helix-turn-helix domain-containing protein n=1 Tax=Citrobacter sp. NCU1 TaxID=2026683 RepID=UPI0013920CD3
MTYILIGYENISAASFILERAPLSHNRVFSILSELHKGGYITLERERLISVRHLPEQI